jgi:predicted HicB family RNase H-like nuclease
MRLTADFWNGLGEELTGMAVSGFWHGLSGLEETIVDAMRAWIETAWELGREIPEPRQTEDYSGKFVVRVPKSLHRALVEASASDNVSLNTYVNVALGRAVGEDKRDQVPESNPSR